MRRRHGLLGATPAQPTPTAAAPDREWPLLQEPTETIRLAGMRGTIAKRMHASLREMAQLTLTMDAVERARRMRHATEALLAML